MILTWYIIIRFKVVTELLKCCRVDESEMFFLLKLLLLQNDVTILFVLLFGAWLVVLQYMITYFLYIQFWRLSQQPMYFHYTLENIPILGLRLNTLFCSNNQAQHCVIRYFDCFPHFETLIPSNLCHCLVPNRGSICILVL